MRIAHLLLLLFTCAQLSIFAQSRGDSEFNFNGHGYSTYIVKIDSASLKRFKLLQNLTGIAHANFITPYINSDPNVFITNAGPWDSLYRPIGLFITEGKTVAPVNLSDGNQMGFYLKPNGVLAINDKGVAIVESGDASKISNIRLAVQSGPMLVINGRIHEKFDANSKNKNLRCGVGLYSENGAQYLVFATSNETVSLYEFASLFKNYYKCLNALCLQSAGCVMQMPFIKRSSAVDISPVGTYIMYVNHD